MNKTGGRQPLSRAALLLGLFCACSRGEERKLSDTPTPPESTATMIATKASCSITDSSVGPVKLGMTLAAAKDSLPAAVLTRTSDGEGVALVEVKLGDEQLMVLHAGEEDPAAAVDTKKRIKHIETFNSGCNTLNEVHPGMLVSDAEKILGKTAGITRSEIEQREFIHLEKQPSWLKMRIDNAGIFGEGSSETTRFSPGAKILSIAISG